MDLHPISTPPTPEEVAAVAAVVGPEGAARGPEGLAAAEGRRHLLLPVLHALQDRVGWVSPGGLGEACRRLQVPPADAYGVVSFYALFATRPRPARVVHVCDDIVCAARGAGPLCTALEAELGPPGTDTGTGATWLRSPCLGLCEQPVAALLTQAGPAAETLSWSVSVSGGTGGGARVRARQPEHLLPDSCAAPPA